MHLLKPNGFLIQGLDDINRRTKNFRYLGINAFHQYPLSTINDRQCRLLTEEQQVKKYRNEYQILEFISNKSLFDRYLNCCLEKNINTRVLFIESGYSYEEWSSSLPETNFLGYEYCPIPIDDQIVTDLDWYPSFSRFWSKLNKNGLFDTYGEALEFKKIYDLAYNNGEIGDGEMDAFICRVSVCKVTRDTLLCFNKT